jgi:dTDP-4-dehydrorhamnose 3,5-epimerase
MEFIKTKCEGVMLLKPVVHGDFRGFFLESFTIRDFKKAGIAVDFVQDNHSMSAETGVLRGLHLQFPPFAQSKLIRVIRGSIFDAVVDVRRVSPTYGKWEGFELTENNFTMLFVPAGCAHGFCTLSPKTEVLYKVDNYYSPQHDSGIIWNDPDIGVRWPTDRPILSEKDKKLPLFRDFVSPF